MLTMLYVGFMRVDIQNNGALYESTTKVTKYSYIGTRYESTT